MQIHPSSNHRHDMRTACTAGPVVYGNARDLQTSLCSQNTMDVRELKITSEYQGTFSPPRAHINVCTQTSSTHSVPVEHSSTPESTRQPVWPFLWGTMLHQKLRTPADMYTETQVCTPAPS